MISKKAKPFIMSSVLVLVVLLSGLVMSSEAEPGAEAPAQINLSAGNVVIGQDKVTIGADEYLPRGDKAYTLTGNSGGNNVVIDGGSTKITMSAVDADTGSNGIGAFLLQNDADVELTLTGSSSLKSAAGYAGLRVPGGSKLTIKGSGSLTVTGGAGAAGIGGDISAGAGEVEVLAGTVKANGGGEGTAAIGGGRGGSKGIYKTKVNSVTLNNGTGADSVISESWYWTGARANASAAYTYSYIKAGTILDEKNLGLTMDQGVITWKDDLNGGTRKATDTADKVMNLTAAVTETKFTLDADLPLGDVYSRLYNVYFTFQGSEAGGKLTYQFQHSTSKDGPWTDLEGSYAGETAIDGTRQEITAYIPDTIMLADGTTLNMGNSYLRVVYTAQNSTGNQVVKSTSSVRYIGNEPTYNLYYGDIVFYNGSGGTVDYYLADGTKVTRRQSGHRQRWRYIVSKDETGQSVKTSNTVKFEGGNFAFGWAWCYSFQNVEIEVGPGATEAPLTIADGTSGTWKSSSCSFVSKADGIPGIEVGSGASLQFSEGNVTAQGGNGAAGIGGRPGADVGNINLGVSGNKVITGGSGAAAVGGGKNETGSSSRIDIGGNVKATAVGGGAGIGSSAGSHKNYEIYLTSGGTGISDSGAGIGSGADSTGTVNIYGNGPGAQGTSTAGGAGIGSGKNATGAVTMQSNNSTAVLKGISEGKGAGIGTGESSKAPFKYEILGCNTVSGSSAGGDDLGKGYGATQTPEIYLAVLNSKITGSYGTSVKRYHRVNVVKDTGGTGQEWITHGRPLSDMSILASGGPWDEFYSGTQVSPGSQVNDIMKINLMPAGIYNLYNGNITINGTNVTYYMANGDTEPAHAAITADTEIRIITKDQDGNIAQSNYGLTAISPAGGKVILDRVDTLGDWSESDNGIGGGIAAQDCTLVISGKNMWEGPNAGLDVRGTVTVQCATHGEAGCTEADCTDTMQTSSLRNGYQGGIYIRSGKELIIKSGRIEALGIWYAGVQCSGAKLTVDGGYLKATGRNGSAGIGGVCGRNGRAGSGGTVTVNGGHVVAAGSWGSAGIGGGGLSNTPAYQPGVDGGDGGTFTINGGLVEAAGASRGTMGGAGIGSGGKYAGVNVSKEGGTSYINGGTVVATGGSNAAGIGGGSETGGSGKIYYNVQKKNVTATDGDATRRAATYYKVKARKTTADADYLYNDYVPDQSVISKIITAPTVEGKKFLGWLDSYTNTVCRITDKVDDILDLTTSYGELEESDVSGMELRKSSNNSSIPLKDFRILTDTGGGEIYVTVDGTYDLSSVYPIFLLGKTGVTRINGTITDFDNNIRTEEYSVNGKTYTLYLKRNVRIGNTVQLSRVNQYDEELVSKYVMTQSFTVPGNPGGLDLKAEFDGEGHSITGVSGSLFQSIDGGSVRNLLLSNATGSGEETGLLAKTINNAAIDSVEILNSRMTATGPYVGGIAGIAVKSTITNSIVRACVIGDSSIRNVGGILGSGSEGTIIRNCLNLSSIEAYGAYGYPFVGNPLGTTVTDCAFDSELTGLTGGKNTNQMLGTSLQSTLSDGFSYETGFYPQIKTLAISADSITSGRSLLGASAPILKAGDTRTNVTDDFTVSDLGTRGGWTNSGGNHSDAKGTFADTLTVITSGDDKNNVSLRRMRKGYLTATVNGETLENEINVGELANLFVELQPKYLKEDSFASFELPQSLKDVTYSGGYLQEYKDSSFEEVASQKVDIVSNSEITDNYYLWGEASAKSKLGFGVTVDGSELDLKTMGEKEGLTRVTLYNVAAYCAQSNKRYIRLTLISPDGTYDRFINMTVGVIENAVLDVTMPTAPTINVDPSTGETTSYTEELQVLSNTDAPIKITMTKAAVQTENASSNPQKKAIPLLKESAVRNMLVNDYITDGMALGIDQAEGKTSPRITPQWYDPETAADKKLPFAYLIREDLEEPFRFKLAHTLLAEEPMKFGYDLDYSIAISEKDITSQ